MNARALPSLRDYQTGVVESVRAAYREGAARVLMVAPTGSGKTIMFAFLIASAMARGKRSAQNGGEFAPAQSPGGI